MYQDNKYIDEIYQHISYNHVIPEINTREMEYFIGEKYTLKISRSSSGMETVPIEPLVVVVVI
jgi:hypothetical protein